MTHYTPCDQWALFNLRWLKLFNFTRLSLMIVHDDWQKALMAVYTAASPNIESYFLNTLLFKHVNTSWCIIQRVDILSTLSVPELFDACIVVHVTVYTVFLDEI